MAIDIRSGIDPAVIVDEAQRLAGWVDPQQALVDRHLIWLADSLNRDAELTPEGLAITHQELVGAMVHRLETLRWIARHPEIADEPIEAPWFLTGLPRSGTTFIQNLFDQDVSLRLLRTWETAQPCPPPGFDPASVPPRIAAAQRLEQVREALIPGFDAIHLSDAEGPDECHAILSQTIGQAGFHNYLNVPGFFERLLHDLDPLPTYAAHRRQLQLLQWRSPRKRWALKYPNHLLFMPTILQVYPDARFVVTHRDPLQTLASLCRLTATFRASRSARVDPQEVGHQMRHFVRQHCLRLMAFAASAQAVGRVVHVDYYRLVAAPEAVMQGLYDALGSAMPATVREQIAQWCRDNPKGRRGQHRYALNEFGLDAGELAEEFADYRRQFAVPTEAEGIAGE